MKQGKVAVRKIMQFKENETFYLRENVKGCAESCCAFVCSFGDDAVQFFFDVEDDHIVSPFAEDNEDIWQGDAVEVFISPDGDLKHYKELEVSPFGVRFYADVYNKTGRKPVVQKITPAFEAQAALTDKGYRVTVRLPYDALPGYERSKVRFNAYCLDMRPDGKQLLYALNPTLCKSFHRPKYFL